MLPISYSRHRFPPVIIQHAVWRYARFALSFRDVEDLLVEPGIDVSNETVRRWFLRFGRLIARNLRHSSPRPSASRHLDAKVGKIDCRLAAGLPRCLTQVTANFRRPRRLTCQCHFTYPATICWAFLALDGGLPLRLRSS